MTPTSTLTEQGDRMLDEQIRGLFDGTLPLVAFANDWRGDPTSKHHVVRTYSRYTNALWIEASGMRRPRISSGLDRSRIRARLARSFEGPRHVEDGLHVLSPLSLPVPDSRVAQRINRTVYQLSMASATRRLGWRGDPLLWVYVPTVAPYLSRLRRRGLVYHCVDRWWAFSEYDTDLMRHCHRSLCREADVVFASSAELLEDCLAFTPNAHLIRHGVEWEHFARAALEPQPRPSEMAEISGPVLGFFGLIHEWVDQDLVCAIADALPDATVVMIGRVQVDDSRLRSRRNIRLLGQKPYAELPAYSAHFDVALIPFAYNELTTAVNPIKLREYLSAGLPVVATALPEIELLASNPMVRTGRTPEQHVAAIRDFLAADLSMDRRRDLARAMISESWLGRCAEMAGLAAEALRRSANRVGQ